MYELKLKSQHAYRIDGWIDGWTDVKNKQNMDKIIKIHSKKVTVRHLDILLLWDAHLSVALVH